MVTLKTIIGSKRARLAPVVFVASATVLFASAIAWAGDFVPPDTIKVSTPHYKPELHDFDPAMGHYEYEVSWQGIPAAELGLDVGREKDRYRLTATAKTYSAIDLFYTLRYRAEGLITADKLSPVKTVIDQQENSKYTNTQISFSPKGEVQSTRQRRGRDAEVYKFDPKNFTLDPFSAAFLARSLSWEEGQVREFDTFNGCSRYLIKFTALEKITMRVNGEERPVWVISPEVKNLSSPNSAQKLRDAKIYITADKARELLMIKSEVFIGTVTTKLTAFEPTPEVSQLASLGRQSIRIQEQSNYQDTSYR